jgi:hypothetical protein
MIFGALLEMHIGAFYFFIILIIIIPVLNLNMKILIKLLLQYLILKPQSHHKLILIYIGTIIETLLQIALCNHQTLVLENNDGLGIDDIGGVEDE